jgi:glycosyltransferase involved in cell wall biosynthesis
MILINCMKNLKNKVFYITSNNEWGGSEELWYASALNLLDKGYRVSLAVKYSHKKIDAIKDRLSSFVDFGSAPKKLSFLKRGINKIFGIYKQKDLLALALEEFKPDIVVLSQGNNIGSEHLMQLCIRHKYRFIVVTQTVAEINWIWLNTANRNALLNAYQKAEKIFFVSQANLELHNFLLGYEPSNAEVIFNPIKVSGQTNIPYPNFQQEYHIAVIGRVECFHKGLDILVKVMADKKWKARPLIINIYGSGPHIEILKGHLLNYNIQNVFFQGFSANIGDIWTKNQILILPSRMEGQSLALLEALYLNRGAIVTNVGGAAEIVEDNVSGFIAQNPTVADIDDALERAWNRKEEWEQIGIKAGDTLRSIWPGNPIEYFDTKIIEIIES